MKRMTAWRTILVLGMLPSVGLGQSGGASSNSEALLSAYQSDPPTYAIPLVDGRTAILWWDARHDPQRPRWVCEVPGRRQGTETNVTELPGGRGDWRKALELATALLKEKELAADGE